LESLGFDPTYEDEFRYKNSMKQISNDEVPPDGSPGWCIWSLRYAYLSLTQLRRRWDHLQEAYLRRAPEVARKGEEIITLARRHGWDNQEGALNSMVAIRNSLGLATDQRCIVVDIRTNTPY
jgi:hypothetical protein